MMKTLNFRTRFETLREKNLLNSSPHYLWFGVCLPKPTSAFLHEGSLDDELWFVFLSFLIFSHCECDEMTDIRVRPTSLQTFSLPKKLVGDFYHHSTVKPWSLFILNSSAKPVAILIHRKIWEFHIPISLRLFLEKPAPPFDWYSWSLDQTAFQKEEPFKRRT